MSNLSVGVVAASGHAGGEMCRLLLQHPNVGRIVPTSNSHEKFERLHPNLMGCGLEFHSFDDLICQTHAKEVDIVFYCAPPGEAMKSVPSVLMSGTKVVDLGPDYRFADHRIYESTYGMKHQSPEELKEAVYGLTEWNRSAIKNARLVANPGCFATACLLALRPCIHFQLLDMSQGVFINAINGTTGASSKGTREIHHAMVSNGVLPYSLQGRRHGPEIEYQLMNLEVEDPRVILSTSHGPFPRGIHAMVTAKASAGFMPRCSREELLECFVSYYGKANTREFFVIINDTKKSGSKNEKEYSLYPNVGRLSGSNFCHIGVDVDVQTNHIKIVAVIDNLVKGAAGSAIQNMNVMFDLEETTGLRTYGL